jgi:hypothetical protein
MLVKSLVFAPLTLLILWSILSRGSVLARLNTRNAKRAFERSGLKHREPAVWVAVDGPHQCDPDVWNWGDWVITREHDGYRLLVGSGVTYGPYSKLQGAMWTAENVRGD